MQQEWMMPGLRRAATALALVLAAGAAWAETPDPAPGEGDVIVEGPGATIEEEEVLGGEVVGEETPVDVFPIEEFPTEDVTGEEGCGDCIFWIGIVPDGEGLPVEGEIIEGETVPGEEIVVEGEIGGGEGAEGPVEVEVTGVAEDCEVCAWSLPLMNEAPQEVLGTPAPTTRDSGREVARRDNAPRVNICTSPEHYVAWLCEWQGFPRP